MLFTFHLFLSLLSYYDRALSSFLSHSFESPLLPSPLPFCGCSCFCCRPIPGVFYIMWSYICAAFLCTCYMCKNHTVTSHISYGAIHALHLYVIQMCSYMCEPAFFISLLYTYYISVIGLQLLKCLAKLRALVTASLQNNRLLQSFT